jgi:hypothetical protein
MSRRLLAVLLALAVAVGSAGAALSVVAVPPSPAGVALLSALTFGVAAVGAAALATHPPAPAVSQRDDAGVVAHPGTAASADHERGAD